jgi:c-di-GMP-binding flagellar brake protein YcgR
MQFERRRYKRFSATAFLNRPVVLAPLPPYFGHPVEGRLVDLSAGGMAIFIDEVIPPEGDLRLTITFPDQTLIETTVRVKYASKKGSGFLHGIEFLALEPEMAEQINRMSIDYIDCELRIQSREENPCRMSCGFFALCRKRERLKAVELLETPVALSFRALTAPAV